jgi:hypothetical protein
MTVHPVAFLSSWKFIQLIKTFDGCLNCCSSVNLICYVANSIQ